MSQDYINDEVQKILNNNRNDLSLAQALICAWIGANQKAEQIKIFNVKKSSSLASYYLVMSALNSTQAQSICNTIEKVMKDLKFNIISTEGMQELEWCLIDCSEVIVHVFQENSRNIYDLDSLWQINPTVEIPQEFYFSSPVIDTSAKQTTENYF